jgi:uncharacterized membrane protein
MELPALKLPQVELPFDIPLLMHPPVDHFIIALPVIILLLEVVNLIVKKRAIGVASFFLLILTVAAAAAAYLTGSVDGKEAFPLLSEAAQGELKEHKLLGTYLMLASTVVLVFKLLSAMINRGLMKALYLLVLILFVAGILKQGKEGGELVYKYGVNVERVLELDNELDDLKEELEELEEANKPAEAEVKEDSEEATPATPEVEKAPEEAAPAVPAVKEEVTPETTATPVETAVESVKTEVKEVSQEAVAEVKEKVEEIKVEVIPQEVETPQIATH